MSTPRLYRLRRIVEVEFLAPGIYEVRSSEGDPVLEMQAQEPVSARRFSEALRVMAEGAPYSTEAPHGTEVARLTRGMPQRADYP